MDPEVHDSDKPASFVPPTVAPGAVPLRPYTPRPVPRSVPASLVPARNDPGQRRSYAALAGTRQSYQRARIGASCRSFGVPRGATGTGTAGPGPPYAPGVLAACVIRAWVLEYANATSGVRVRHGVTVCHRRSRRCRVDAGAVCLAALTARGAAASWPGLPRRLRHVRPQSRWRAGRGSRGPGRTGPGQAACPAAWPDYPGCVTT